MSIFHVVTGLASRFRKLCRFWPTYKGALTAMSALITSLSCFCMLKRLIYLSLWNIIEIFLSSRMLQGFFFRLLFVFSRSRTGLFRASLFLLFGKHRLRASHVSQDLCISLFFHFLLHSCLCCFINGLFETFLETIFPVG